MLQQRQRPQVRKNEVEISNVNMTSIHCKLQEEAEKIRKWQTSSDLELKQKMAKLKDCEQLISKQRNQVLEMQVENETLAAKLQKEQLNQTQINLKLKTSRELFIALKNHSENLQNSILRGEEDRDSLRMFAADNIKQIKDIKVAMQEMSDINNKQVLVLKSCVKDRELVLDELKVKYDKENEIAKKSSDDLKKEITACKESIDNLSRELLDKRALVSTLENKIQTLEDDIVNQKKNTVSKTVALAELESTLEKMTAAHKSAQSDISRLQLENKNQIDKLVNYKTDAELKIEELQSELTELTYSLTNLSTQFNEATTKHDRFENENKSLKDSVSQLVKCVEELQEKQEQNEQEMLHLNEMYNSSKQREVELEQILQERDDHIQELKTAKDEVEAKFNTISSNIEILKRQEDNYIKEIEMLAATNAEHKKSLEEFTKKSSESDINSKNILLDLEQKNADFNEAKTNSKQYEENWKSVLLSLTERECELKILTSVNKELNQQVTEYTDKLQTLEETLNNLNQTITSLSKDCNDVHLEFDHIKSHVIEKDKELLKKDSQCLKLKKENEKNISKIKKLINNNNLLNKNLSSIKTLEEHTNTVVKERSAECDSLNISNSNLEQKIQMLQNDLDVAKSGSSNLCKSLSVQLEDATLQVTNKDNIIEELKESLSKLQNEQSRSFKEMKIKSEKSDAENKILNNALSNKVADISALAEEINKLQNKMLKLEESHKTSSNDASNKIESFGLQIIKLENEKDMLTKKASQSENEKLLIVSKQSKLEEDQTIKNKELQILQSENGALKTENSKVKSEIEKLKIRIDESLSQNDKFKNIAEKLEYKESQLKIMKQSLEEVKSDFLISEKNYSSTIDKLKIEIKKLNKSKVQAVLSNISSKSPIANQLSSFSSPKQKKLNEPDSPKTPSVSRSKKRRVAFGKSPSWHASSDEDADEDEDTTVSSSTGISANKARNLSLSKSPKVVTYSSSKSPSRLKLTNTKSPALVNDLLAKYPTPSSTQKRGTKLPDAYVKRKEETLKKRKKLKLEACSWFDTEAAFGFDEK